MEETIGRVSGEIRRNGEVLHTERVARKRSREQYLQQRRQQKEKEVAMKAEVLRLCGVEASRIRH